MKTLLIILLLAISVFSQLPDISKFEYVASANNGKLAAFADRKDSVRDGDYIKFTGLLGIVVQVKDGEPLLDPATFLISDFRANCKTNAFAINHSKGMSGGKVFDRDEEPNTNIAQDGFIIYRVIRYVCDEKTLKTVTGKEGI